MSIWCSCPYIGFDKDADPDETQPSGGQVRSYATGWSNHYPTTDGTVEREAALSLATIPTRGRSPGGRRQPWSGRPAWCAGGADDDDVSLGPWVRMIVHSHEHDYYNPTKVVGEESATVVLDEAAVRELVAQLTDWLAQPKVRPS